MLVKCSFAFALLGVISVTNASAQAVWQADVKIQSLAVTAARTPLKTPRPVIQPRVVAPAPGATLPQPLPSDALEINVVVHSDNDDDARNAKLLVFLPPESRAISMPPSCVAPPPPGVGAPSNNAYVTCTLGDMGVNATQAVRLTIARPPAHVIPRVGVYAYSDSPDPNTGNNHAETVLQ
jgi:hypothetical protein